MKYVAELAHVLEVSLLGSADLGFWAERLRVEGLTPVEHAGRVRVLLVACDSKFFGVGKKANRLPRTPLALRLNISIIATGGIAISPSTLGSAGRDQRSVSDAH